MDCSDVTVIIPTLNEEKNIDRLITILKKSYSGINIIVSDDGSTDGTGNAVRSFKDKSIVFFDRSGKKVHGLTASVVDAAKRVKTDYIVVMDGDLQHPPDKVRDVIALLKEGHDIVICAREKDLSGFHIHRRIMSKVALLLGRAKLMARGVICIDNMSGFFGIKSDILKDIITKNDDKFELEGYKVLFDTLKYVPKGTTIIETPYKFGFRTKGDTKIKLKHIWLFFRSLFK